MTALVFDALKRTLRAKGITYAELADRLGVSEPTVKRIFHEKDCKLGRLSEICDAIGVELDSIFATIGNRPVPGARLSRDVEWKLAEQPALLDVLILLTEKFTPDGILQASGISPASLFLYFRDLEKLGLVECGRGLTVRLTVDLPIQWDLGGPLKPHIQKINQAFTGWVIDRTQVAPDDAYFNSFSRRMRPETVMRLEAEVSDLVDRAKTLAWHDQHTTPDAELAPFKWAFAVGRSPFADIFSIGPHPKDAGADAADGDPGPKTAFVVNG
ncbi:helix-turn-helix transcriptional regulator [Rhodospirillaceae bacterium KN72]|uniref:Helix-turn-helix transcriptional regulator n=1 Tax=Pacificispira spongiicola TaxID=2729598 RepID=A0A7Y0E3N6_9PROT|nr:helix-turn-helix transcriptional regulator [Pacificispira spongiicola]NMM46618.1 helix-turn-helix transcriptional regulator [Pacificispira spongiicola]